MASPSYIELKLTELDAFKDIQVVRNKHNCWSLKKHYYICVKDVKYIWYGMTYRELRDILKEGIKIREASVSEFKMVIS